MHLSASEASLPEPATWGSRPNKWEHPSMVLKKMVDLLYPNLTLHGDLILLDAI
jgi:hypothetical protein